MGKGARNRGGTGGAGYPGHPQGYPDSVLSPRYSKYSRVEAKNPKVEVVSSREFRLRSMGKKHNQSSGLYRFNLDMLKFLM